MTQLKQTGAVRATAADPRSTYVTGLYNTPESANRAYDGLRTTHGFGADDIDVVMSDATRERYVEAAGTTLKVEEGNKAAEGLATGGAIGGGSGRRWRRCSRSAPRSSSRASGGHRRTDRRRAGGAGAGAATGGIIGALVGVGIPRIAPWLRERAQDGGIVVGARARDDAHAEALERDFETYGGTGVRR